LTQLIEDVLGVRALLADPARWCKNSLFEGENGEPICVVTSVTIPPDVIRMCLLGAQIKHGMFDTLEGSRAEEFARVFVWANGLVTDDDPHCTFAANTMVAFNNRKRTKHADVIQALDRMIAYAEVKGM
jgi:hypothetical protein